jgi:hypothetical protein
MDGVEHSWSHAPHAATEMNFGHASPEAGTSRDTADPDKSQCI